MNRSKPRIDSRPASDEGHDPRALRDRRFADLPGRGAGVVKLGVDPVEVDLDLGLEPRGKRLLLPVRRRVAGVAIDQRGQGRGVDAPREERGGLGRRQVDPVRDVAMAGREVVFAIDDDRAVDQSRRNKRRRTAAAVGDDQVGAGRAWTGRRRGPLGTGRDTARRSAARGCLARSVLGGQRHLVQLELPGASRASASGSSRGSAPGSCTSSRGAWQARGRAGRTGRGRRRG